MRLDFARQPQPALLERATGDPLIRYGLTVQTNGASALDMQQANRSTAKYWHVADAVKALGKASSTAEIKAWLAMHHPRENHSDVRDNLAVLTVNDPNRRHHIPSRRDWRSDTGDGRDLLFRKGRYRSTTYEAFRPAIHGHWDLRPDATGTWQAVPVPSAALDRAEAEAERRAFEGRPPVDSDHDSRVWTLTAVAQRRGQAGFRNLLLQAYGGCCAITGSNAQPVLEAAHILPYRGEHTNRVDNGLLLRSDLHTLFDLGLVWITPTHRVAIAAALRGTEYERFAGRPLRLPARAAHCPNPAHLASHARVARERRRRTTRA